MTAIVRETATGWEVVDGTTVTTHDTQGAALYAALEINGGRTKAAILHDPATKEPNGAWRWLHATDVEDEAFNGARIDEQTVTEAVASLNDSPKAEPINGGTPDSLAHGDAGNTPANGYAHHAVEVVSAEGRHGAYVLAEIVPAVDENIASGRLAFTSIGLGGVVGEDETIRNADWDHLALTNKPAIATLTPSAAIRKAGDRLVAVRTRQIKRGLRPMAGKKTSIRSELTKLSLRGPALEALTKLCATLGVDLDAEMAADEWDSPVKTAVRAIRELAGMEKTLEALTGAAEPAARSLVRAVFHRAEVADADLEMLAKALGLEPGAAVADMIKAAEGMEPKKAPAEPTEEEKAEAAKVAAEKSAGAESLVALRSEVAALRAKDEAREDAAFLDGVLALRKMTLRAETREQMLTVLRTDRKGGRATVEGLVKEIHVPPTGTVVPPGGTSTDPLDTDSHEPTRAQITAEIALIRAAHPTDPQHVLHARARKNLIARKR